MTNLRTLARAALPHRGADFLHELVEWGRRHADRRHLRGALPAYIEAYQRYWQTGEVPRDADRVLFYATWASGGTLPQLLAERSGVRFEADTYRSFPSDLLSDLDPEQVSANVRQQGYFVSPHRIATEVVDDIVGVLDAGPAIPRGDDVTVTVPGIPTPAAPTWWMAPEDSLRSESVRRLLVQRRLVESGASYLGVDPLIMSVVLWRSFAWPIADKNSAQAFHFDNDRSGFLKMFVYLTDVDENTGPHVYVSGSHRRKPRSLLHGQRLSDPAVARHFPREQWKSILGERGTVFFADTHGIHKGGQVTTGTRAMFQINLASDRFGAAIDHIGHSDDAPVDLRGYIDEAPRYFSQLYLTNVRVS